MENTPSPLIHKNNYGRNKKNVSLVSIPFANSQLKKINSSKNFESNPLVKQRTMSDNAYEDSFDLM